MVTATHALGYGLLALVALERVAELLVSERNARATLARGGVEAAREHYPAMVAFHALFLALCAVEPLAFPAAWPLGVAVAAAVATVAAQALRWWAIATLGERWSTRVVVLPGAAPVTGGPYRLMRHPNYLAVIVELAALPLALGAWRTALLATVVNAWILAVRIPAEERALGVEWARAFAWRSRLLPLGTRRPRAPDEPHAPTPSPGRAS